LKKTSGWFALLAGASAITGVALAWPVVAAPDLSGVWWNSNPLHALVPVGGGPVPLTAQGKLALAANAEKLKATTLMPAGKRMEACLPFGPTRTLQQPYPLNIIQKGPIFLIVYEHNHVWERVYMDEKPNPDEDLSYFGHSVGRWDGATAVVETTNFNDQTFLDDRGLPHSEQLAMTRRIHRLSAGNKLEILTTITDPVMYAKPWSMRTVLDARPNESIREYVCGLNTLETRYGEGPEPHASPSSN
jgi:hypothetical protein